MNQATIDTIRAALTEYEHARSAFWDGEPQAMEDARLARVALAELEAMRVESPALDAPEAVPVEALRVVLYGETATNDAIDYDIAFGIADKWLQGQPSPQAVQATQLPVPTDSPQLLIALNRTIGFLEGVLDAREIQGGGMEVAGWAVMKRADIARIRLWLEQQRPPQVQPNWRDAPE